MLSRRLVQFAESAAEPMRYTRGDCTRDKWSSVGGCEQNATEQVPLNVLSLFLLAQKRTMKFLKMRREDSSLKQGPLRFHKVSRHSRQRKSRDRTGEKETGTGMGTRKMLRREKTLPGVTRYSGINY